MTGAGLHIGVYADLAAAYAPTVTGGMLPRDWKRFLCAPRNCFCDMSHTATEPASPAASHSPLAASATVGRRVPCLRRGGRRPGFQDVLPARRVLRHWRDRLVAGRLCWRLPGLQDVLPDGRIRWYRRAGLLDGWHDILLR